MERKNTSEDAQAKQLATEIGQRVRALRNEAGLSGRKLAAEAGVSQPFLSQLELGQTAASIATLYRIANALNTTPAELLPSNPTQDVELVRAPHLTMSLSETHGAAQAKAIFRGGKSVTELHDFVINPGDYVAEWFESEAEHVMYVLEGQLRVEFEDRDDIVVNEGDALFYHAKLRHRWLLDEDQAARVILVAVST